MFAAVGGLVVAVVTAWLRGCAMVGNCRCVHLRPRDASGQPSA